jgi:hypothetical protein
MATTIPQMARAMRAVLTTTAAAAAQATPCVQRTSPLGGATCRPTWVVGFVGHPQASLEALAPTAAPRGVPLTPQALAPRLPPAAAAWLAQVLRAALPPLSAAAPVAIPLLERCPAVAVQERATSVGPEALAAVWPGGGGTPTSGPTAARKLQGRLAGRTGPLEGPARPDGRASARAALLPTTRPAGARWLAAVGDGSRDTGPTLDQHGGGGWSRWQVQTAVDDTTGQPRDLRALREAPPTATRARAGARGAADRRPARWRAGRVPPAVADERRRRWRAAARPKGRLGRARRLAVAAWTRLVPNGPVERWTSREALVLGRARWPIARLCTLWQSPGRRDESRSLQPWRILCAVAAKRLAMGGQHGLLRVSGGTYPHRRLPQAAPTVQKHALHMASAWCRLTALGIAITTVQRGLAAGCRMNRRKQHPHT